MKKGKRLFAGIMVAGMLATMGFSAFADNVQHRAAPCDHCGIGMVNSTVYRGDWQYAGEVACVHEGGAGQRDERQVRTDVTYYSCTYCDYSKSSNKTYERFIHLG